MAARTDVHRPRELVTEDYEFLGAYDRGGPETMDGTATVQHRIDLINSVLARGYRFVNPSNGDCGHCGHTPLRYVALMLHRPTGAVLRVGEICLENRFDRATEEFQRLRRQAELDRQKMRIKHDLEAFVADYPDLAFLADRDQPEDMHYVLVWTSNDLRRYGSLFDWKIERARKIVREVEERKRRERENPEPEPVAIPRERYGRTVLYAEVLGTKEVEGYMGGTALKALLRVQVEPGKAFKVWTTVPAAARGEELKGQMVRWSGTLVSSHPRFGEEPDPAFGILKNPRVVVVK
jgi:hypothetical protein